MIKDLYQTKKKCIFLFGHFFPFKNIKLNTRAADSIFEATTLVFATYTTYLASPLISPLIIFHEIKSVLRWKKTVLVKMCIYTWCDPEGMRRANLASV